MCNIYFLHAYYMIILYVIAAAICSKQIILLWYKYVAVISDLSLKELTVSAYAEIVK